MDDEIKSLLEEAYALDEIANEGSDELIARVKRHAPKREIVYKKYEPSRSQPVGEREPSPASVDLDPATQARWDALLWSNLDTVVGVIGKEVAAENKKLRNEIAELRKLVNALSGDLAVQAQLICEARRDKQSKAWAYLNRGKADAA